MPFTLLVIGFIAAAFIAVLDPIQVNWIWFAAPLLVGFAGVIWHRMRVHAAASHSDQVSGSIKTLSQSLHAVVNTLKQLTERGSGLPTHEARFEIDRLLRADLLAFANAREAMRHAFGIQQYADVMSAFAAGERYVNRVWSASADGYVDEVTVYLQRALEQFSEAQQVFDDACRTRDQSEAVTDAG